MPIFIRGKRLDKFQTLPQNIKVHNLANGIPFPDSSVDYVYHSHFLEHLDRDVGYFFFREVYRVLRNGGVHRVVVPDLEKACRAYMNSLSRCESDPSYIERHDQAVAGVIEQSVRREASGSSAQTAVRRRLENILLGDARRRGETHQWMYDRFNLQNLFADVGFGDISTECYDTSRIPDWPAFGLDINKATRTEYKPESLYMEGVK